MSKYDDVQSYEDVAKAAGLPLKVDVESLLGQVLVIEEWEAGTARLPQTGETTQGFWVIATRTEDDKRVTFFCGQTVLVKALKALAPPFRTTIVREHNAYEFR